jgi:hypothetical protein
MRHLGFSLIALLMFLPVPALAQEKSVVLLTVNRTTLSVGETLLAQVIVKGPQQVPDLKLLKVDDFDVAPAGRSSRVNIINGVVNAETIFSYHLRPRKPGKFFIGPAVTTINGVSLQSDQVEINVQVGNPNPQGAQKEEARSFYITVDVDNLRPYLDEQIVYTFRLFNRAALAKAEMKLPDFSGFLKEPLGEQKAYNEVIHGVQWHVAEIRWALFPLLTGEMTIPSAQLVADVIVRNPPFGNRIEKTTLPSRSISLLVSRPPADGTPRGYKKLVGHITLTGSISKQRVKSGESTTLLLTVEGDANIRDLQIELPEMTDFKVYDDKPVFTIRSEANQVIGKKVFKKALVPLNGGEVEIPKIAVAYFDPDKKAYRFAETKPIRVAVSGVGKEKENLVTGEIQKKGVSVFGRDLMPIKREIEALKNDVLSREARRAILMTLLVCLMFYLFLFIWNRRRDRLSGDHAYLRREKAYKRFIVAAKVIHPDQFFEQASNALRAYLGDRFNFDGGALTSADTDPKLRPLRVSGEMIRKIETFLKKCEAVQYGRQTDVVEVSMEELTQLVLEIEKNK